MPTAASMHDTVNYSSMPMDSQLQQQALQQLSDLLSVWSSTVSSSCDQSMQSSIAGNCQGWAAMLALANNFDMMSIGGSSCSARAKMPWNYTCPRRALLQN
jgi:hypothetical protein